MTIASYRVATLLVPFHQHQRGAGEIIRYFPHEVRRERAVDNSMIERDREVHHATDDDLSVAYDRALLNTVRAENADLRIVDHREGEQPANRADVRDGKRAARDVVVRELAGARLIGKRADLGGELEDRLAIRVMHDRHDEPGVRVRGD